MQEPPPQEPVIVPHTGHAPDVQRQLVESFVRREGTDYGPVEDSHDQKVAHVTAQIERGEADILFDPNTESVTIVTSRSTRAR